MIAQEIRPQAADRPLRVALVGNPNCGKTALFNQLTGSRQKVANYSGVTIERKEGRFIAPSGRLIRVLDLPGAYSLAAASPDEAITRDICLGRVRGEALPDLLVCVVDATNLRLHLRFVLELARLGRPMVVVLNMFDAVQRRGIVVDRPRLEHALGIPLVETVAVRKGGIEGLVDQLDGPLPAPPRLVPDDLDLHAEVNRLLSLTVSVPRRTARLDDAIDRWALHPVFGLLILGAVLFFMFQAVFSWAVPFQDAIQSGVNALGSAAHRALPAGPLQSLLANGIIAGAGSVLAFMPQILFLFLFILTLEESGYLPRGAFLMDRLMMTAGLSGRAFIPLLSSFACAVPGIMATRTIPDPRDRRTTILVAPLITCSARLPVYALLIGAFVPRRSVLGMFNLQGLVLFLLYLAGIVAVFLVAFTLKQFRGGIDDQALLLELPSYRLPRLRDVAIGVAERARIFLRRVGGIILALTVLLWLISTYPQAPADAVKPAIDYSIAGHIGPFLQHLVAPLGFNWQICIALVPGMAAREVAVGALGTVYAVSASGDAAASHLTPILAASWPLATALSLLVWYVFAPQCISTLAIIRRETGSTKTMLAVAAYLLALAYIAAFLTYQIVTRIAS